MATLLEIMALAASIAGEGSSGAVGADSTTHQLLDQSLRDSGSTPNHLAGAWLLTPNMDDPDDYQRQCTAQPFNASVGGLTVTRPWSVGPSGGDPYYIFNRAPALTNPSHHISWQQAVNDALSAEQTRDILTATLITNQTRRFTVATVDGWTPTKASIQNVFGRTDEDDYTEYHGSRNGRWVEVHEDAGPGVTIETSWTPGDDLVMVEVLRPRPALSALTDTTDYRADVLAYATVWRFRELMHDSAEDITRAMVNWRARYTGEQPSYTVQV